MLRPIDEKSAKALIDERVASQRIGDAFVYEAKTGGRIYLDETGYLYDDAPQKQAVDATIETPFD